MTFNNNNDINKYLISLVKAGNLSHQAYTNICKDLQTMQERFFNEGKTNYIQLAVDELIKAGKIPLESNEKAPQGPINDEKAKEPKQKENGPCKPNFDVLAEYIAAGFTLKAQREGKDQAGNSFRFPIDYHQQVTKYTKAASEKNGNADKAFIRTLQELKEAIANGVLMFTFRPAEKQYLCIDIDRHANESDGLKEFYTFLESIGARNKTIFNDIEAGSFPLFTESPRRGYHLYFKVNNVANLAPCINIAPNVETKSGNLDLTAAGSVKGGKPYLLHGHLADAPQFPAYLLPALQNKQFIKPAGSRKQWTETKQKEKGVYNNLEQLAKWAETDPIKNVDTSTKHGLTIAIARKFKNKGITYEQCFSFCCSYPPVMDHTQLESTIQSIYNNER